MRGDAGEAAGVWVMGIAVVAFKRPANCLQCR
jgi:hypothetical protein